MSPVGIIGTVVLVGCLVGLYLTRDKFQRRRRRDLTPEEVLAFISERWQTEARVWEELSRTQKLERGQYLSQGQFRKVLSELAFQNRIHFCRGNYRLSD